MISRRNLLRSVTSSAALGGFGVAGAAPPEGGSGNGKENGNQNNNGYGNGPPEGYPYEELRYMVGVTSRDAARMVKGLAKEVHSDLDWGDIGSTIVGLFTKGQLNALRNRPDIRYIEQDRAVTSNDFKPWGIDRIDADRAHAVDGLDSDTDAELGGGIDVAIIDSGIDSDHDDLQDHLGTGKAFISCTAVSNRSCSGSNSNPCNEPWDDDDDHGTHCAGVVAADDNSGGVTGVAPDVTLHAAKVLNQCGNGASSDVAEAIKWTADQDYDVASLSLGAGTSPTNTMVDACSYAYYGYSARDGISNSASGVLLVASTGNDGCSDCVGSPANINWVVGVTASDTADGSASFNSKGPETDLIAPGVNVLAPVGGDGTTNNYDFLSGTSMACPHVSGAAALLMSNGYNHEEAKQMLYETAEDIGLPDDTQGEGLLDVGTALGVDGNSGGLIDSFEDGDLSEYTVDTSSGSAGFNGDYQGSNALQLSGGARIYTPAGSLPNDAAAGDTFVSHHLPYAGASYDSLSANGSPRFLFGVQDGNNYYYAEADSGSNELVVGKVDGGTDTRLGSSSVSVPTDAWIQLETRWRKDGTITAELFDPYIDSSDPLSVLGWASLGTVSVSDSTWTSGGHGWSEPTSGAASLHDYATGAADSNSCGLTVVSDRPTLNGTSITVNGRYRNPTDAEIEVVGVEWRQVRPSTGAWNTETKIPSDVTTGQAGFSFDLDTIDASVGCHGYQYHTYVTLKDGTRAESRRISTWNDRSC